MCVNLRWQVERHERKAPACDYPGAACPYAFGVEVAAEGVAAGPEKPHVTTVPSSPGRTMPLGKSIGMPPPRRAPAQNTARDRLTAQA